MTKFTIETNEEMDSSTVLRVQEIFLALIKVGGLTGVRGGKTIIHFDGDGNFQGISLDYMPFRKRKKS